VIPAIFDGHPLLHELGELVVQMPPLDHQSDVMSHPEQFRMRAKANEMQLIVLRFEVYQQKIRLDMTLPVLGPLAGE
jgi:hypothetical protein